MFGRACPSTRSLPFLFTSPSLPLPLPLRFRTHFAIPILSSWFTLSASLPFWPSSRPFLPLPLLNLIPAVSDSSSSLLSIKSLHLRCVLLTPPLEFALCLFPLCPLPFALGPLPFGPHLASGSTGVNGASSNDGSCTSLELVFARGTTESQSSLGVVGGPLYNSLKQQVSEYVEPQLSFCAAFLRPLFSCTVVNCHAHPRSIPFAPTARARTMLFTAAMRSTLPRPGRSVHFLFPSVVSYQSTARGLTAHSLSSHNRAPRTLRTTSTCRLPSALTKCLPVDPFESGLYRLTEPAVLIYRSLALFLLRALFFPPSSRRLLQGWIRRAR